MNSNQQSPKLNDVSQFLLDMFLEPYKDNCKYLKNAHIQDSKDGIPLHKWQNIDETEWIIKGDFSIPESCYIDDTGHFNAVEFNICYNQLCYILVAYLVENKLLDSMKYWDLKTYKQRQLSNCLIAKFSSKFKKQINARRFQGLLSINKSSSRGNLIILKTSCAFYDDNEGWAEGDVTIAILNEVETIEPVKERAIA
ncbi:MAG: FcoT family thioesterase [Gloeotrichia echinulata CP02]